MLPRRFQIFLSPKRFVNLCQRCHFDIDLQWLQSSGHENFFTKENLHTFDLLPVELLLRKKRDERKDQFWIKTIELAKALDVAHIEFQEEAQFNVLVEEAKNEREIGEVYKMTDREMRKAQYQKIKREFGLVNKFTDIRHELRRQAEYYDNFWKCRHVLDRLDEGAASDLMANVVGETRYAMMLYRIYQLLAAYQAYATDRIMPSLLIESSKLDPLLPTSICPFCKKEMQKQLVHCKSAECERKYNNDRQKKQRRIKLEDKVAALRKKK